MPGIFVGCKTKIEEKLIIAKGPVRTGVIKILPKGKSKDPVPAGRFCLNGDTEMTGAIVKMWIN